MAQEKKPVHKVQMTDGKRQIIQQLLQEYDIETAEDIQPKSCVISTQYIKRTELRVFQGTACPVQ